MNPHLELLLSNVYDGALASEHLVDLRKSALTDAMIAEQFIRSVPPSMIGKLLGFDMPGIRSAMLCPFGRPPAALWTICDSRSSRRSPTRTGTA